ncbi:DUF4349 domain-containing protein [Lacinutrix iliipiscaria]|uniref:DUF4349 domain-containing protein n=1 Tax=Lacinutrix iliipiscaria TaxID=1230532 RepID=A0ABW5WJV0_9FLAO
MKYLVTLFILILPLACSNNSSKNEGSYDATEASSEMALEEVSNSQSSVSFQNNTIDQKLIKESFLRFQTQDLDKTYQHIIKYVEQNNGFIQDDNSNKSYNRLSRNLIIRMPSVSFQKTIDSISNHVEYFDTKRISSKDVTEEFIDIEARLKAKKTLEARYLELLSKAKNVKEILEIERELSSIREEIEAKQGRLKYLQNKVSLSTLNIEFYKLTAENGVTVSYGTKMVNAIKSGFNGISLFFLGLLHIWPFILILIFCIFLFKRWLNKKNKK